jgi:hypothetical protein
MYILGTVQLVLSKLLINSTKYKCIVYRKNHNKYMYTGVQQSAGSSVSFLLPCKFVCTYITLYKFFCKEILNYFVTFRKVNVRQGPNAMEGVFHNFFNSVVPGFYYGMHTDKPQRN